MPTTRPFFDKAMDQFSRLRKSHAARGGPGDGRHHRRIHAVGIDGDVVLVAVGDAIEDRVHAFVVQLISGDDIRAVSFGGGNLLGPCAALGADANLENVRDVLHFRCASDRAGKAVVHAVEFVTPIDMRIDLHQRDRAAAFIGAQTGIGIA